MSIDNIYKYLLELLRKNQSGGISSTEFANFWNAEQSSIFDDLIGRFQKLNNSKEGMNTGLIQDETILTKLSPFTKTANLPAVNGVITRPSDFVYRLAIRVGNAKVTIVTHDKWWSIFDDVIDPPSITDGCYYALTYGATYTINPSTIAAADMDYIMAPPDVKWGFILDSQGRQTYDPGPASVQSLWDVNTNREITKRILKSLGVSLSDREYEEFGESIITKGS
jgi:hypothetical protein